MKAEAPVVIFTENADWHSRRLQAAIEARGYGVRVLSLAACGFAVGETAHGLALPGFGDRLPAAAFVRIVANGTMQQITARLGILHALAALSVPVVNSARAVEACVDKSTTSFLLARAGIATPRTWTFECREGAQAFVDGAERALVLKPLFGAQGRGLRLVRPGEDLPEPDAAGGLYYLQEFVECASARLGEGWQDRRVLVVGGRCIAAMLRRADGWITNIHQGARPEEASLDYATCALALAATQAVGADYAGVDLIEDADGRMLVLEVNSMPAWKGLQKVTEIDLAAVLAAHLCPGRAVAVA